MEAYFIPRKQHNRSVPHRARRDPAELAETSIYYRGSAFVCAADDSIHFNMFPTIEFHALAMMMSNWLRKESAIY